ncbi:unnamed protein product [Oncorhynchus mykiss]|uniref:Uncharacterized protein n=1 Tax=Oncorhynchus mykiss TaxID=8022 RepID=A0A060VTV6_ONCMY|nr:unnamed protein product [Oncorhynchus mykiss]
MGKAIRPSIKTRQEQEFILTALPTPASAVASQDYSYDGYGNQSNYNAQAGANQSYGANPAPYHNPVGYGRGDPTMNYQYR